MKNEKRKNKGYIYIIAFLVLAVGGYALYAGITVEGNPETGIGFKFYDKWGNEIIIPFSVVQNVEDVYDISAVVSVRNNMNIPVNLKMLEDIRCHTIENYPVFDLIVKNKGIEYPANIQGTERIVTWNTELYDIHTYGQQLPADRNILYICDVRAYGIYTIEDTDHLIETETTAELLIRKDVDGSVNIQINFGSQ